MLRDNIFYILFLLIHSIATIYELFYYNLYAPVRRKIQSVSEEVVKIEQVQELTKDAKKPVHLTVLLNGEEPLYKDLTKIVIWCFQLRIPYLSFYDCTGIPLFHSAINRKM